MISPEAALRALEHALERAALLHDFQPTVRVTIEIKDGKAVAALDTSVMLKRGDSSYRYDNESVAGTDWSETISELARRRDRQVAVFTKQIAAPTTPQPVNSDDEIPF